MANFERTPPSTVGKIDLTKDKKDKSVPVEEGKITLQDGRTATDYSVKVSTEDNEITIVNKEFLLDLVETIPASNLENAKISHRQAVMNVHNYDEFIKLLKDTVVFQETLNNIRKDNKDKFDDLQY